MYTTRDDRLLQDERFFKQRRDVEESHTLVAVYAIAGSLERDGALWTNGGQVQNLLSLC